MTNAQLNRYCSTIEAAPGGSDTYVVTAPDGRRVTVNRVGSIADTAWLLHVAATRLCSGRPDTAEITVGSS